MTLVEVFASNARGRWLGGTEMIHQVGRCEDDLTEGLRRLRSSTPCGRSGMVVYAFARGRKHLGDDDRLRRRCARAGAGTLAVQRQEWRYALPAGS
jgi:hypothetical protein